MIKFLDQKYPRTLGTGLRKFSSHVSLQSDKNRLQYEMKSFNSVEFFSYILLVQVPNNSYIVIFRGRDHFFHILSANSRVHLIRNFEFSWTKFLMDNPETNKNDLRITLFGERTYIYSSFCTGSIPEL